MAAANPRPCCVRHALDPAAKVCPDCGTALVRCRGFDECRQVLGPSDHCPVHVAPRLTVLGRCPPRIPAGGSLSLPLVVRNTSGCAGSELHVRRIFCQTPGGNPVCVPPEWDRLRAGEEKPLFVDTGRVETPGRARLRLTLVLGWGTGGSEETFAFGGDVPFVVEEREAAVQVGQAGGDVIVMGGRKGGWTDATGFAPTAVALERADAFELRQGLRGYAERGLRVPRSVRFEFAGFPEGEAPAPGRPFVERERLRCGRNSRAFEKPNDLRLLALRPDGAVDRDLSGLISGVHFELALLDDRLRLVPLGANGTWVNGARADGPADLAPGDRVRVLAPELRGPELEVRMQVEGGFAERITIARTGGRGGL
jgi:hypothetical protein